MSTQEVESMVMETTGEVAVAYGVLVKKSFTIFLTKREVKVLIFKGVVK